MSTQELATIAATDLATKLGLSLNPQQVIIALQQMVFKPKGNDPLPSNEEQAACMMVAAAHGLDPFRREIFLVKTNSGYQPMLSVDGWSRISRDKMDSVSFEYAEDAQGKLVSCTCTMRPKGWSSTVVVTEYLDECYRDTPAWKKSPRRMLRHRAFMQAARLAFGVSGVYMEVPEEGDEPFDSSKANGAPPAPERKSAPRSAAGLHQLIAPKAAPIDEIIRARPEGEEAPSWKLDAFVADVSNSPITHNGKTINRWTVLAECGGAKLELKTCDDEIAELVKRLDYETFDLLVYARKLDRVLCISGARVNRKKSDEQLAAAAAAAEPAEQEVPF